MSTCARFLLLVLIGASACTNPAERQYESLVKARHSDPKQTLALTEKAFETFRKAPPKTAWLYRLLYANLLLDQGLPKQASELLDVQPPSGLEFAEIAARLTSTKARLARRQEDTRKADQLYSQAEASFAVLNDPCWQAEVLTGHTQTLLDDAKFAESAAEINRLEKPADQCADPYWRTTSLWLQGTYLRRQGRYEEALPKYQQALSLAKSHNYRTLTGGLWDNIVSLQISLGDLDQASADLKEEDEAYAQAGQDTLRSKGRGWLGLLYSLEPKQSDKAIEAYNEALKAAVRANERAYQVRWLNELTALYCNRLEYAKANDANAQALSIVDREQDRDEYLQASLNAVRIARLSQGGGPALKKLEQLRPTAETQKPFIWQMQAERAQVFQALGKTSEARREFDSALETAESGRNGIQNDWYRITFSAKLLQLYQAYIDFLTTNSLQDEALQVAESFHGRQMAEKLNGGQPLPPLPSVQMLARAQRAVILSYWIGPKSYLWVTTPTRKKMIVLEDTSKLEDDILSYRQQIDAQINLRETSKSSRDLYKQLVAPADTLIPKGSDVIVIPDGPLANLNFDTLIPPGPEPHYWFESVSLRVAPSISLLHSKEGKEEPIKSLLLVGDVNQPDPKYPALPGSKREMEEISKLFADAHPVLLVGDKATPQGFEDAHPNEFSAVHMSAHAVAVKESPLESAIILSADKKGNYRLTARDLIRLRLNVDLVTLSSCQGAGAKAQPGEGLVGLTWALLSAGTHHVVAGLWNVSDSASEELMNRFYTQLKAGKSPSDALRAAKLEMAQYAPYYWAAFQLYSR